MNFHTNIYWSCTNNRLIPAFHLTTYPIKWNHSTDADPKMAGLIKEGPAIFGSAYCSLLYNTANKVQLLNCIWFGLHRLIMMRCIFASINFSGLFWPLFSQMHHFEANDSSRVMLEWFFFSHQKNNLYKFAH